ncbi:uncharacterized protein LOC136090987 [Hydra vulgaris]|uniref:Uncharacterized protein LOC136090987 n=1 Tax=Hydra vulgaris TaxID=6087 RepID=A0ABM4DHS6_HYDVU
MSNAEVVSMVMVRELLNLQKETILSFFTETVKMINIKFDSVQKSIQEVRKDLDDIKAGLTFVGDACDDKVKSVNEKISKVKEELSSVKIIQGKISTDNNDLKLKSVDAEDRNRRNNLRLDGLPESRDEKDWEKTKEKVRKLFAENLNIKREIKIERAHRVGVSNENRERTIVMKLHDYEDKKTITDNASKLKGTNIFINEDYCSTTRKVRKELFAKAKIHRQNGYYAKVVYNKLIVHEFQQKNSERTENLIFQGE